MGVYLLHFPGQPAYMLSRSLPQRDSEAALGQEVRGTATQAWQHVVKLYLHRVAEVCIMLAAASEAGVRVRQRGSEWRYSRTEV